MAKTREARENSSCANRREGFTAALCAARTPAEFLARAFQILQDENPQFNFATFARRCRFASRSFARQLVLGEKDLTWRSLPRVVEGLALDPALAKILSLMLEAESESDPRAQADRKAELVQLQAQVQYRRAQHEQMKQQQDGRKKAKDQAISLSADSDWPYVYASLGSAQGQSLAEIAVRAKLSPTRTRAILNALAQEGLVLTQGDKHLASQAFLQFDALGEESFFRKFFLHLLERVRLKAQSSFRAKETCFASAVISVKRSELPKLAAELHQVIDRYAQQKEDPDGDSIACISASLIPH